MGGHAPDAMTGIVLVDETQRAHDPPRIVLGPDMHGSRRGVERVDVLIHALLLDDEDRLTYRQNAEQRARGQLVEVRRMDPRRARVVQLAACGVTADVQNEQRCAATGITLRHSGHARVVEPTGLLNRA